ncbi:Uncharacterised protein [Mycobacteroides abscessus subsp. massiliense]|nr:Uncharacterised protein [Mycobacteroides abscessus subsp. massiliense]
MVSRHGKYEIVFQPDRLISAGAENDFIFRHFFKTSAEFHPDCAVSDKGLKLRQNPRLDARGVLMSSVEHRDARTGLHQFQSRVHT